MEGSQTQEKAKALGVRGAKDIGAKEREKIFEAQKASGKIIKNWCKENGISPSANYHRQKEAAGTARPPIEVIKPVTKQRSQAYLQTEKDNTMSKAHSVKVSGKGVGSYRCFVRLILSDFSYAADALYGVSALFIGGALLFSGKKTLYI